MSLVDPWLHEKGDGFPILYVRSHAARLPGGLVRDWLFRCKVQLTETAGKLILKVTCIKVHMWFVCIHGAAKGRQSPTEEDT